MDLNEYLKNKNWACDSVPISLALEVTGNPDRHFMLGQLRQLHAEQTRLAIEKERDFTPEELRILKQAVILATDELSRREQPHTEAIAKLDELYQKLRNMGA